MQTLVVPARDTSEEITGPLVDYLRSQDPRLLRVHIVHYAYDRRNQAHLHNPWVLSWYAHGPHELPAKMPLWYIERYQTQRPLTWAVAAPTQGELF